LNKKEFIQEVAKRSMLTEYVIDELFNISSQLSAETLMHGETVEIPKFGKIVIRKRNGKNLRSGLGNEVTSSLCTYPAFELAKTFKNKVKNSMRPIKKQ